MFFRPQIPHSQNMKTKFAVLLPALFIVVTLSTAKASMIFSVEAPGVQSTSVAGVLTETFNVLPNSSLGSYSSSIGTYSPGAVVVSPDAYGGAQQSNYVSIGAQSSTTTYSLTFNAPQTFFGLYWQAADGLNELQFYRGSNLLRSFNSAEVFSGLSQAYFGNPNNGLNNVERFAYINFFAVKGSSFDRIVFNNPGFVTGFETDNHSILAPVIERPFLNASDVPEPATLALTGAAFIALALYRRR